MRLNFSVEQDSFDTNIKKCLRNLYATSKYSDITIVCDDNKVLKSHKFILCEYSQVFKSILSGADMNNPIIIIKDASYNHLNSLFEFLYTGETAVSQSDIKDINKLANEFQVNDWLTVFKASETIDKKVTGETTKSNINSLKKMTKEMQTNGVNHFKLKEEKGTSSGEQENTEVTLALDNTEKDKSYKCKRCFGLFEDDKKLMSHMFVCSEFVCCRCNHKAKSYSALKEHTIEEHKHSLQQCTECDALVNKSYILRHIREVHEQQLRKCKLCDYTHKNYNKIKLHEQLIHNDADVTYPCSYCDYKTKTKAHLSRHVSIHEGIKYPCQLCPYKATGKQNLRAHVKFVHEKIRIQCDQCGYQTQRNDQLVKHINKNHP